MNKTKAIETLQNQVSELIKRIDDLSGRFTIHTCEHKFEFVEVTIWRTSGGPQILYLKRCGMCGKEEYMTKCDWLKGKLKDEEKKAEATRTEIKQEGCGK